MDDYQSFFRNVTGHASPRAWQTRLSEEAACRSRLIRIPTGLGKTQGVACAWLYHRLLKDDPTWPRRLIWCLPMRVLVEQVVQELQELVDRLASPVSPAVTPLMGGQGAGDWFLHPDRPAILVGTQDMLLSRGLNRGYGSGRARWPWEFGLLHQDALWVMDEVQLMDVGLATSAQLQAFRDRDVEKQLRPCHTWWMSATLQSGWLHSVDTAESHQTWVKNPCEVAVADRASGLWNIAKNSATETLAPNDAKRFAQWILGRHKKLTDDGFGRITLVVCNTVDRACETFDALASAGYAGDLELMHSRFRSAERDGWRERFVSKSSCVRGADRIIVATQVVEAGVDITAGNLITELAPWPSLVQRFGRCARYGGSGDVLVVDRRKNDDDAAPYEPAELRSAWEAIQPLDDVGIAALETYEASLTDEERQRLYPYAPAHLLMRNEFDELFDTTADLTGADLDISRFIRSGDERDLQIFWDDLDKGASPSDERQPHRRELCAAPFLKVRDWLCGRQTQNARKSKLRGGMRAWVWDWFEGQWVEVRRELLLPGRIVCVASSCGGYREDRGFDAESKEPVSVLPPLEHATATEGVNQADAGQDNEQLSINPWKTIACHCDEAAQRAKEIGQQIGLPAELQNIVELAARWHDWGKAHPAFQGAMRNAKDTEHPDRPDRQDLAKGPKSAWRRPPDMYRYLNDSDTRPAFRHELASVLGLFAILEMYKPRHEALLGPWVEVLEKMGKALPDEEQPPPPTPLIERLVQCDGHAFDLVAYLVACHHGKVRLGLHAAPQDQDYPDRGDDRGLPIRGVRDGDELPAVVLTPDEPPVPKVTLSLSPAAMGLSCQTGVSWRERCIGLMQRHSPTTLALLEAILRAADVQASQLNTNDPTLSTEACA